MDGFFALSKIGWTLVQPDHLLVALLLLSAVLISFGRRSGHRMLWLTLIPLVAITLFPLGNALLRPLETRFAQPEMPEHIGGIIVLGGGEITEQSLRWQQPQFNASGDRILAMLPLMKRYPEAPVIFSGGSGSLLRPEYRGGDVVAQWLESIGEAERVMIERYSRNTHENARESRRLLHQPPNTPWLLVTSAYHMPRAVGVFRHQGWPVVPWPVDYFSGEDRYRPALWKNLRDFSIACREWLGLGVYYLTGKTDQWFPAPLSVPRENNERADNRTSTAARTGTAD